MYDYLQTDEWKKQRSRVLTRDLHTCQICGKRDGVMNVHHIVYRHPLSEVCDQDLVTLCPECHERVHSIQKQMNDFSDERIKLIKKEWGCKMSEEINKAFPSGIYGTKKSRAISIIRRTFYEQRGRGWSIMPDFETMQKNIKTRRR